MKIRTKLGVTYLSVSLLTLGSISAFIYFYVKNSLVHEVSNHLTSVASIQKHRIESIIDQNLERIRLVSSRTQLRISLEQYLESRDPPHLEKLNLILRDALESIPNFLAISVLDTDGRVLTSTNPGNYDREYSQHDFFPVALYRNNAEYFYLDEEGQLKLYLSGPLKINNKLIGVLLIESNAKNIISLLSDYSGLYASGETTLGRRDATSSFVEFLAPARFDEFAALQRKLQITDKYNPLVQAIVNKKQMLTRGIDYRGKAVIAAINYIPQTGWGISVKVDEAEAFTPIHDLLKYIAIILLVVMIIVTWVSYTFASIISKPIVALTNTAHNIDQGDLSHRAEIYSNDEVGELAGSFNNMANNLIVTQYNLEKTNKELQTHRDHLEDMVSQRTQELEAIVKELEAFSYSVSHDLRSPLRAIDGFSAILMEDYHDQLDDEGKKDFARIRNAAQRMGNLIDDLLELSRINRSDINRKDINLSAKVSAAISRLSQLESERKVEVVVQPDLHARGDDTLMDVVISNLIGNAWKYTGKTPKAKIEFGQTQHNGEAVYFVKDNGIGFDMEYSDKIFGAFQRLVGQNEYPGTGIGLATVARVIGRHGGRIWAEAEPDKGATFYFTVPSSQSKATS